MPDWDSRQYLKFESDRTRPPRDLLAQVPLERARKIVDLGCGPGNSTELLVNRFLEAQVTGLDSSPDMLRKARERLSALEFIEADIAQWRPEPDTELLFSNATFQWVPDHPSVLKRLLAALPKGGVLAVQMPANKTEPTHTLMAEVARQGGWLSAETDEHQRGNPLDPEAYYDLLRPHCQALDMWHTIYAHVLDNVGAIVEWFKSTALRPYTTPLSDDARAAYLAAYEKRIAQAYRPRYDGKVILNFPRFFIVAVR
ncbi:MAG: trans-aconitate 2-methyltransferase [Pseudolabrys sp.]